MLAPRRDLGDATSRANPPLVFVGDSGDTWQMMVAVVQRAMRMRQPPAPPSELEKPAQPRRDNAWVEDHYVLLLAAGY